MTDKLICFALHCKRVSYITVTKQQQKTLFWLIIKDTSYFERAEERGGRREEGARREAGVAATDGRATADSRATGDGGARRITSLRNDVRKDLAASLEPKPIPM